MTDSRVSQLCSSGILAFQRDREGRVQIDRESLSTLVVERARLRELSAESAERAAAEAADRNMKLANDRRLFEEEKERRRVELLKLKQREVSALESIADWVRAGARLRAS